MLLVAASMANPVPRECSDDDGRDRCSAEVQTKTRAMFGFRPIEDLDREGTIVRRVSYVDGYGNDVVAIEFTRPVGKDPVVRVYDRPGLGEGPKPPMEAMLTQQAWTDVIDRSTDFDRLFQPKDDTYKGDDEYVSIVCVHSWAYWAEAADTDIKPRSKVSASCDKDPLRTWAWEATKIAIAAFPACDALERKHHRSEANLLSACFALTGDRLAAAEVFNEAEGFRLLNHDDEGRGIAPYAAYDVRLDWAGEQSDHQAAVTAWMAKLKAPQRSFLYYDWVRGVSQDKVIVNGGVVQDVPASEGRQIADAELTWERVGSGFALKAIKVGPFRPWNPPTE